MNDTIDIDKLKIILEKFAQERDWDKFYSTKNLAMSVSCEAGELVDLYNEKHR